MPTLKGQCDNIFVCWLFHQIAPPGPIRGTLGRFQFFLKIRTKIFDKKIGSAVYDTLGNGNLAEYLTLWNDDSDKSQSRTSKF